MSELTEDACRVCGSEEDEAFLVLCDGCDRPFHTYCHAGCVCCRQKPKGLFNKKPAVPDGDWYCKFCAGHLPKLEDKSSAISSIFVWGDNEDGQLGLPDNEDKVVWSPKRVHELDGIGVVYIASTETATVAICNDGNLYSVGTGTNGQLGHQDIVHEKLTKFRMLESVVAEKRSKREGPFKQISAGRDFFLALTTEGHVYTWGNGEHGQLGHQENKNKKVPKKISALREWDVPADLVTCGGDFVLMTSTDPPIDDQFNTQKPGVLMTMGANTHGQLGDGSGRNQWLPQRLNKDAPEFTPKSNTEIEDPTECLLGRDLRLLSAGNAHAVVVTSTMKGAWAWGFGEVGCLGIPRPPAVSGQSKFFHQRFRVPRPRYIKALKNEMVNQVACGGQHTLLLLADSRVMSMGDNEFGQLGVKDHNPDQISVVGFQTAGKIKQIAAGDKHSVALTTAGEVYTWGQNKLGQLGLGATVTDPVFEPTKVLGIGRMKKIYVGPNQIFAVEYTNDEIDLPVVETPSEPPRGKKRGAGSSKQPIKKGKK